MSNHALLKFLGIVLALFAAVYIFAMLHGCARAPAALTVVSYKAELDACREEGKRAKSYEVYVVCADATDARYGLKDGGAP
jgi:hypothetical protein